MRIALVAALSVVLLSTAALAAAPPKPADVKLDGMKVTIVPEKVTLEVTPLEVTHRSIEGTLKVGEPSWRGPYYLPGVAWVCQGLDAKSLVVTLADKPDTKLVEGKDYLLSANWGTLAAVESSQYPAGTKLKFDYDYTKSRIDLVEKTADGKIVLVKGVEDMGQPHLPEGSPGATPLLSIYLPNNTKSLTMDNINLIDPSYDGVPPVVGREYLKAVKAKIAAGKPVTIVFLGDSITAQQPKDFRDGKGSFVDRFTTWMQETHPEAKVVVTPREEKVEPAEKQIVIVKAGVGGDDTPRGLKRLDADVLSHKPDVVVVMFGVNDENARGDPKTNVVPPDAYKKNMATIVDKIEGAGAVAVVMTTSMKMLPWESTGGNLDQYAAAAREVARDKKACLVDNFQAWQDLPKRGYNYAVFLGTCINHPVDLGHDLFFRGLKSAFEDK